MRWMTVRTGDLATPTKAVPRNQTRPSANNRKEGTFKPLPTFYKTEAYYAFHGIVKWIYSNVPPRQFPPALHLH